MTLSIRAKTFLGLLLTLVILTGVFAYSLKLFNENNIDKVESKFSNEALLRVENLLRVKEESLVNIANSIAVLDPLWELITGEKRQHLSMDFLDTLPIDCCLIVNAQQQVVFQQSFHALSDYEGNLLNAFGTEPPFTSLTAQRGFVRFNNKPMLVVTRPIVNPQDNTYAGALVVGLLLGDAFWNQANNELRIHARLTLAADALSACPDEAYKCLKKSITGLHGKETFVLHSGSFRFMSDFTRRNLSAFLGLFAFASVVMVFITQKILDVLVLSRLVRLGHELEKIGHQQNLELQMTVEVDGADEVAAMGDTINAMLERLRVGDLVRFQQEKRFADMIEHAGLVVIGIDHKCNIMLFNHAAEKATGYSRDDVLQENFFDLFTTTQTADSLGAYIA